ncbi:RDD family protein [Falsigemmobacter faecalis]|uniref:RDD family protein n=1 Tax=Falsigemmobacter faecalis TaxID=2488730 RepID=A0A3P3DLY7_9RHOB|nr:RDD family protein [Falsigemmobacter faecalis]RRH75181.1 RDD family protein [Falsigemmobacter faecalis]
MNQSFSSYVTGRSPGLPDPDLRPEFYQGVAAKRFIAWLIDLVLVGLATGVAAIATLGIGLFFLPFIFLMLDVLYRLSTLSGRGATFGHRLMGVEFRDRLGARPNFGAAVLLTLGLYVSTAFVIPQLLSALTVLMTSRRQSLTDLVIGTAAINRPASTW